MNSQNPRSRAANEPSQRFSRTARRTGWAGAALLLSLGLIPLSPAVAAPAPTPSPTGEATPESSDAPSPTPSSTASPTPSAPASSAPATPKPSASATPKPPAAADKPDKPFVAIYTKAPTKLLKTPDAKAPVVVTAMGGSHLMRQATRGTWAKVSYGNVVGWVLSSQLTGSNPTAKKNTAAYSTRALALSAATNPNGGRIAVPAGSRITVVGSLRDWERISYNGRAGFTLKGSTWRTTAPTVKVKQYSRWVNAKTALRTDTTPAAKVAITIPAGTHGYVVAKRGDWSQLNVGTKSAWVLTSQLATSAKSVKVNYKRWVNRSMRMTPLPNYSTSGSRMLPVATLVTALRSSGDWVQVKVAGRTGFLPKSKHLSSRLTVNKASNTARFASKSIALRADPRRSPYAKSLKRISAGTKVQVTGRVGGWARVKYGSTTGYVVEKSDLVSTNKNSFSVYGTLRSKGVSNHHMAGSTQRDGRPRIGSTNLYFWKRMAKSKNDVTVIARGKGSVVQEQYIYSASRGKKMFKKLDGFESYYRIGGARVYTAQVKRLTDGTSSWTFYANPKLETKLKRQSTLVRDGDFNHRRRY